MVIFDSKACSNCILCVRECELQHAEASVYEIASAYACGAGTGAPVVLMTSDIASLGTHYSMTALLGAVCPCFWCMHRCPNAWPDVTCFTMLQSVEQGR